MIERYRYLLVILGLLFFGLLGTVVSQTNTTEVVLFGVACAAAALTVYVIMTLTRPPLK